MVGSPPSFVIHAGSVMPLPRPAMFADAAGCQECRPNRQNSGPHWGSSTAGKYYSRSNLTIPPTKPRDVARRQEPGGQETEIKQYQPSP